MQNSVYVSNTVKKVKWERTPSDRVNSVVIHFDFSEEWNGLLCVAQFSQGGKCYSQVIENGSCSLPVELTKGYVKLGVFGTKEDGSAYRATTIPFEFSISESGFCITAETPIPPTPDLYDQLINRFQKGYVADKVFNPLSEIAQSGIAVEQAKQQSITESKEYTDTQISAIPEPVLDHSKLINRDMADQHPVEAIAGLQEKTFFGLYTDAMLGGAIGNTAMTTDGGAVGYEARSNDGGAVGNWASSNDGGAVGNWASSNDGGAVGFNAVSQDGFAGGLNAQANGQHNIQLGTGTNNEEGTLFVSNGTTNYKMMNADGTIPPERLPDVGTTDYTALTNKPKINGVELVGEKTSADLGLYEEFAPIIKNTVSGVVVAVNDVTDREHNVEVKCKSDMVVDFSNTKLEVCGRNLANNHNLVSRDGKTKLTATKTGFIVPITATYFIYLLCNALKKGLTYKLMLDQVGDDNHLYYLRLLDKDLKTIGSVNTIIGKQFTVDVDGVAGIQISFRTPSTPLVNSIEVSNFRLVVFGENENYEPYKGTTYPVLQDGTVPNVKSISPNMTMYTDTDGVNLTATYNADTKRYIDNKLEELKKLNASTQALALGG